MDHSAFVGLYIQLPLPTPLHEAKLFESSEKHDGGSINYSHRILELYFSAKRFGFLSFTLPKCILSKVI